MGKILTNAVDYKDKILNRVTNVILKDVVAGLTAGGQGLVEILTLIG